MAPKHKVSVSTNPNARRLGTNERRAARVLEIANQQSQLKREAAERRSKRAGELGAAGKVAKASVPRRPAGARRSNPR